MCARPRACAGVRVQRAAGRRHMEERSLCPACWPLPASVERRRTPALRLPWPGPRLPPPRCSGGSGDSPAPGPGPQGGPGSLPTVLAPSAACCVMMNERLVTHRLEDGPCAQTTVSPGQGEGCGAPVSAACAGSLVGLCSEEVRCHVGPRVCPKRAPPGFRVLDSAFCPEQQRMASGRHRVPRPLTSLLT